MQRLYLFTTACFWLLIAAFWLGAQGRPPPTAQVFPPAAEKAYSVADVAAHATPADCWMAIRGGVYDLTPYLPDHPARPELLLAWCGKEATAAYETKLKGRPHSPRADELLDDYRIGTLRPDS